jgi:hypothetical protein
MEDDIRSSVTVEVGEGERLLPHGRASHSCPGALLREGLGRVGEAEVVEPRMPSSVDEVKDLSWDELNLVIAMSYVFRHPSRRRSR